MRDQLLEAARGCPVDEGRLFLDWCESEMGDDSEGSLFAGVIRELPTVPGEKG